MSRLPLLEGVLDYIKEDNISFCMPGHKSGKGFLTTDIGKKFCSFLTKFDITEVEGVDNLHNAEGIIKEAQNLLSQYYKSKKSYFLVNGSTSGNLAMIFSTFKEGDKIIVERNCHKSIYNGIIMRKINPIYVKNEIDKTFNAPISVNTEHFLHIMRNNKDAKGIIVTYPNYYGICLNLKTIIEEAKKLNMKVLVDSAHGAHFGVTPLLPESAVELGADMVVMSSHKTLPSFTQTAYLHIGENIDEEKVDFYVSTFLSTSPSYLFMCSMDYARYYLQEMGKKDYEMIINIANEYKNKINNLINFHIIDKDDLPKDCKIDLTRYIINLKKGYSGYKFSKYLRENNIQVEMSDNQNVVLIFTPFNTKKDFDKLYDVMKKTPFHMLRYTYKEIEEYNIPKLKIEPYKALNRKSIKIEVESCKQKISGKAIIPYPPGIPLVLPGEIIDESIINLIKSFIKNDIDVIGYDKVNKTLDIVEE